MNFDIIKVISRPYKGWNLLNRSIQVGNLRRGHHAHLWTGLQHKLKVVVSALLLHRKEPKWEVRVLQTKIWIKQNQEAFCDPDTLQSKFHGRMFCQNKWKCLLYRLWRTNRTALYQDLRSTGENFTRSWEYQEDLHTSNKLSVLALASELVTFYFQSIKILLNFTASNHPHFELFLHGPNPFYRLK